jgi:hypothetical protein
MNHFDSNLNPVTFSSDTVSQIIDRRLFDRDQDVQVNNKIVMSRHRSIGYAGNKFTLKYHLLNNLRCLSSSSSLKILHLMRSSAKSSLIRYLCYKSLVISKSYRRCKQILKTKKCFTINVLLYSKSYLPTHGENS